MPAASVDQGHHWTSGRDRFQLEWAHLMLLLGREAALRQAGRLISEEVGAPVVFGGLVEGERLVLRSFVGARTDAIDGLLVVNGTGLGGAAVASLQPQRVQDYVRATSITHEYDAAVTREGLGGMMAVPIVHDGRVLGCLYAAARERIEFGDAAVKRVEEIAQGAGPAICLATKAEELSSTAVREERRRIAMALHDSVGASLFGIGVRVRDLVLDTVQAPELLAKLEEIERETASAAAALRQAVQVLHEADRPEDKLLDAIREEAAGLERVADVRVTVIALDDVDGLDEHRVGILAGVVREALFNVRKHAQACSVAVTVYRADGGVGVCVADDGVGLTASDDGQAQRGLGLRNAAQRLERVGGTLTVNETEDGGVALRCWVPA